jgi:hypothetical protein
MSHWNYRLVKLNTPHGDYFEVREVYYNDAGEPCAMTERAVGFGGETPEEAIKALKLALRDAENRPVFEPPEKWADFDE